MNKESSVYTVIYASVLVILSAVLLAFTSQALSSYQKKNEANDKKQQILRSLNVVTSSATETEAKYNELIKESFVVNEKGQKVDGDAFSVEASKMKDQKTFPVFVADVNGKSKYIMAVYGSGLWGPLWGYIALNDDKNSVFGADISHAGETPGLGAEISTTAFCSQFINKQIFKNNEFKSIAVVKPGKTAQGKDYVDGISGGTITSVAVEKMIDESLNYYVEFLKTTD